MTAGPGQRGRGLCLLVVLTLILTPPGLLAQVPCSMLMLSGSGTIRYMNYAGVADKQQQDGFHFSPAAITAIILGRVVIFPIIGQNSPVLLLGDGRDGGVS